MDWYYSDNEEQHGPVSGVDLLEEERDKGTLVWRETMVEWRPLDEMRGEIVRLERGENPELEVCALSGEVALPDDMVEIDGSLVRNRHKDAYIQFLSEGGVKEGRSGVMAPALTFGSVWRHAWGLFGRHFWLIAVIHLTVWLGLDLVSSLADYTIFDTGDVADDLRRSWKLYRFFENWIGIIAVASILRLVVRSESGMEVRYGTCLQEGLSYWGKIWATQFLQSLVAFVVIIVVALLILLASLAGDTAAWVVGIGLGSVAVLSLVVFYVRTALAVSHVVLTGEYWVGALRASIRLTKGHFWKTVGYGLIVQTGIVVMALLMVGVTEMPWLDRWWVSGLFSSVAGVFGTIWILFLYAFYQALLRED